MLCGLCVELLELFDVGVRQKKFLGSGESRTALPSVFRRIIQQLDDGRSQGTGTVLWHKKPATFREHLRHTPALSRDHRHSAGHGFDGSQAKRFVGRWHEHERRVRQKFLQIVTVSQKVGSVEASASRQCPRASQCQHGGGVNLADNL